MAFTGGFFPKAASSLTVVHLPGDFNLDGQVTSADIPAMLQALTDLKRGRL
jgi:hypothetical protein